MWGARDTSIVGLSSNDFFSDGMGGWIWNGTSTIGMVAVAKEGKHGGGAMVNPLEEA